MALNFRTKKYIKEHGITDIKKMEADLRKTLKEEFDYPAKTVYAMSVNDLVQKYEDELEDQLNRWRMQVDENGVGTFFKTNTNGTDGEK